MELLILAVVLSLTAVVGFVLARGILAVLLGFCLEPDHRGPAAHDPAQNVPALDPIRRTP